APTMPASSISASISQHWSHIFH
ncbi:uncharacterized protein METZ01_LOCUS184530, partial [marine metagenome]